MHSDPERVLACIGPGPGSARLAHAARDLAAGLAAPWTAAAVDVPGRPLSPADLDRREVNLRVAESLGAEVVRLVAPRVADALLHHARAGRFTRIVVGKPTHPRLWDRLRGSVVDELIRGSGDLDVHVVTGADGPREPPRHAAPPRFEPWGLAAAGGWVAAATAVGSLAQPALAPTDAALLLLLAISVTAYRHGRAPALAAAGLSVAAYNFFFVEPYHTFRVTDPRHLVTFAVMFAVGLAISGLADRLRAQEARSLAREQRTAALYTLARALAGAGDEAEITRIAAAAAPAPDDPAHADAVARLVWIATERAREARAAELATVKAHTEELRAALLSAVSHDLRTPLATILGSATALRTAPQALPPAAAAALADGIAAEAEHMDRLVTNLLDLTALASGRPAARLEWVPVDEPVGSALRRAEPVLGDRPVSADLDPDLPLVAMDPILVEHALINLLENAARHTPLGTPITVRARREADHVALVVVDRGPGLPDGPVEAWFEPFARGPTGRHRGSGLGLAIVRGVALAHGGSTVADRHPEGGAILGLRLPLGTPPTVPGEDA